MTVFEKVKQATDCQKVVSTYYAGELKRKGQNLVGSCPFHPEKTPSFYVRKESYKCFGCNAAGDSIKFVRTYLNLSSALDAANIILKDLGINVKDLPRENPEAIERRKHLKETSEAIDTEIKRVCDIMTTLYKVFDALKIESDIQGLSKEDIDYLFIMWMRNFADRYSEILITADTKKKIETALNIRDILLLEWGEMRKCLTLLPF